MLNDDVHFKGPYKGDDSSESRITAGQLATQRIIDDLKVEMAEVDKRLTELLGFKKIIDSRVESNKRLYEDLKQCLIELTGV
jgi:hypothetical protein